MQFRQILFIELLGGIGDVLIALPAIHALAQSHPNAQLTVLTFAPGGELLEQDPWIDRVVYAPRDQASQAVEQILSCNSFDLIVSDTNYDNITERIQSYKNRSYPAPVTITNLWRSPPSDERVSDRFLHILFTEQVICSDEFTNEPQLYLTADEQTRAQHALGAAYRPLIVLCSDAGMPIKRWATANFVRVGKALQQQYGATILVPVGADQEQATQIVEAMTIAGIAEASVRLWPRSSLRQIAAVLAQADLMIAADTGLARIAAALSVPTITLFGPSWYERYGQPAPHINLQGFPGCPERIIRNFTEQHCWYSGHCPFEWQTCLDDISPAKVLEPAQVLLERSLETKHPGSDHQPDRKNIVPSLCFPVPAIDAAAWKAVRNLLVMRLDNVGDVIMTSPVLDTLRRNLPTAKITLMTSPAGALAAPLLPWVDGVLPWRTLWQDLGRLDFDPEREWELIETLRRSQFDAVVILTSFSQSPHPAGLICALAGIPLRLGQSKEQDWSTLTHPVASLPDATHQVDRNLHLLEAIGFSIYDRRLKLHIPNYVHQTVRQLLHFKDAQDTTEFPSYILLNPWTSCQSRNYDSSHFAGAARQLSDQTGWPVVITGVQKDQPQVQPLLTILEDRAVDLVGATSLIELAALVANARLVLTNNTSTMHIADATATPNVVLFAGTEQESQWRPRYSPSRLLRRATVCSPCYQFVCPYQLQCLEIAPEAIVEAGLELLRQTTSRSAVLP